MKTLLISLKNDPLYLTGLVLLAVGTFVFCLPIENNSNFLSAKFLVAYVSFIVYSVAIMIDNKKATGKKLKFYNLSHNIMLLLLGNLSAYALNLSIPVFDTSVFWLQIFLVVLNVVLVVIGLRKKFEPDIWNYFAVAVLTAGLLFQFYQSIYTIPVLLLGTVTFWFFGISLHAFLPAWFTIQLMFVIKKYFSFSEHYFKSIIVGTAIPLLFLFGFAIHWNNVGLELRKAYHNAVAPLETDDLPAWVKAGQRIDDYWMAQRMLNTRMRNSFHWGWDRAGYWEEGKWYHDPFIVIASLLGGDKSLNSYNREKIKNTLSNARHKTEPRLWSGNFLSTKDIVTNIQLFPEYRMAYTEKTFVIKHNGKRNRQQEAIYSFYLPEGAVVSSASLWVAGEERPAYLTTKSKAETAYKTIVGRERRDPLLVTWQEGNRITARVFPCTPEENRQFKIGFTAPLKLDGDKLIYENIDFDGPDMDGAMETVRVLLDENKMPKCSSFKFSNKGGSAEYVGNYKKGWKMSMEAPALSERPFSFNGRSFQLKTYEPYFEPSTFEEIYLDINKGWSKKEFKKIWEIAKDKNVFVYNGSIIRLTEENKFIYFDEMSHFNYSVFPFQKLDNPNNAVVVTKASGPSPLPSDLGTCAFSKNMGQYFQKNKNPIKTINIGHDISPFIKSLKELRSLHVHSCDLKEALGLLSQNKFPSFQEGEKTIVMEQSGMKIQRLLNATNESKAPDHLLRLFTYNDLMTEIGGNYFSKKHLEEELIERAKEAYIVTPVSSLVTLETQEDYDRFDIKAPEGNSLKNASIKQSGAVPEPHEWVLIIICLLFALFLYRRHF